MCIITCVVLIGMLFIATVAGRRGRSSSRRSTSRRYSSGSGCTTDECVYIGLGVGCGIVVAVVIFLIILCCLHNDRFCIYNWCRSSNKLFPSSNSVTSDVNEVIFRSGLWTSRYDKYNSWQSSHQISLAFNPQSMKVTGSGFDDMGAFDVEGSYSQKTKKMDLTKTYRSDNVNESTSAGQKIKIQVVWNTEDKMFKGTWNEEKQSNKGVFELSYDEKQYPSAFEKV